MLTRYCIDGGLEPEQAYRLSDFYILKMDSCTTIRQVADLHHEMAKDFTGKMILQKKSSILSKPVMQCVDYIYSHIKERITIQVLADHTELSTNYLSRIFKQNLGVSVSDYIREQKIEKATHLLRYSDKSIVDIANYLAFSSQSHFILGHMQRGGSPTCKDRVYASTMGALAVDLLCEGKSNRVIGYQDGKYVDFDIDQALSMKKTIPEYQYKIAKSFAI